MAEHRLSAFGMMLGRANAGSMRRAQNHWAAEASLGAVAHSRCVVHKLIEAGIKKSHKLDLANGFEPLRCHTNAETADEEFSKRRIQHALRSKALLEASGRAEDAAVDADVFTKHNHARIVLHRASQCQVDGLDQRCLSHCALRRVRGVARRRYRAAWHRDDRTCFRADVAPLSYSVRPPPRRVRGTRRQAAPRPPCSTFFGEQDKT